MTSTDPQNVSGPDPARGRALLAGEVSPTASDAEATSAPAGDDVIYVAAHPAGGVGICCSLCESTLAVDAGGIVTAEEVRAVAKAHLAAVHNEGGR